MNYFQNPYQYNPYKPQNGIIWVQGIEGAKAYQMQPNSNAVLLDSETDGRFYIKVADNVGMCTLRTFKFEEITESVNKTNIDTSQFVTREEFNQLISQLGGLDNGKQSVSAAK